MKIPHKPKIISRSKHNISRKNIPRNVLKVLYRLKKAGFAAYLVGGGVRDLLAGLHPKDFDIATDAFPSQIKRTFSNCRLIGRRFRLAHVFFGREIVEVATFRSSIDGNNTTRKFTETGMIVRDNVYGTIEEDAWRRDFTIKKMGSSLDIRHCFFNFCFDAIYSIIKPYLCLMSRPFNFVLLFFISLFFGGKDNDSSGSTANSTPASQPNERLIKLAQ